jgi:tRNA (guanine-N7-)-methyltransferase
LKRGIRSSVLRQGRTTPAQKRALDELTATYGIPYRQAPLEAPARPLVLEIGSGMGETTAAIAAAHPDTEYIAVEVHGPGVGSLLKRIDEQGLKNLGVTVTAP